MSQSWTLRWRSPAQSKLSTLGFHLDPEASQPLLRMRTCIFAQPQLRNCNQAFCTVSTNRIMQPSLQLAVGGLTMLGLHWVRSTRASQRSKQVHDTLDSSAVPQLPDQSVPRVILFGDSITQMSFSEGGFGSRLADYYQRRADVLNRGYSGCDTCAGFTLRQIQHSMVTSSSRTAQGFGDQPGEAGYGILRRQ